MAEADRDEGVSRAYRELGGAGPSRALDEAILAAARRPRARWPVPVSIAAVLVLAVGVTLRMLPQEPEAEKVALSPRVMETPRPVAKPAAPPAPAPQVAQAPARAREAPAVASADAGRRDERAEVAAAPRALASAALAKKELKPEEWVERILDLRRQGRQREADDSLAEFRKRYPDYKLPAALAH